MLETLLPETNDDSSVFARILAQVKGGQAAVIVHAHPPTRTVAEAERNLDFDTSRIVKTIAFGLQDGRLVLAALRGLLRVDYARLAALTGVNRRQLATLSPQDVLTRFGVEPGSVSPVMPLPEHTELLIDADVLTIAPTLYCGSGRPDRTLELAPADLVALCSARVAPFSRVQARESPCDKP